MAIEGVIELINSINIPLPDSLKIYSWKFEVPVPKLGQAGHIEIRLVQCTYNQETNEYEEIAGIAGMNIIISGDDFNILCNKKINEGLFGVEALKILGEFIVDKGYIPAGNIIAKEKT